MTDNRQEMVSDSDNDRAAELEMRKRSRRSFLLAGISAAAGITAFNWLRTRPDDGAVSWPLRRVLEFNERLSHTRFSNAHLAPNFPTELAETPRENGGVGLNEPEHGAPLRLATPVKYGIKNIKRIGTIRFTNTRPADYWAERGYDWYAGL